MPSHVPGGLLFVLTTLDDRRGLTLKSKSLLSKHLGVSVQLVVDGMHRCSSTPCMARDTSWPTYQFSYQSTFMLDRRRS